MKNDLVVNNMSKRFGGVQALRNVSLTAEGGRVHALMGENGAGKSTLIKILAGFHLPDEGHVALGGQVLSIDSPRAALAYGISVIHQEFSLARHLTVAENIFLGDLKHGSLLIDWKGLKRRACAQLDALGFGDMDVSRPVGDLSIAEQQVVEIAKALSKASRVLVLDEPTAVLTEHETTRLFKLVNRLKQDGVCIIYVSHRLEEIFALCDVATVLKDGAYVGTVRIEDIDESKLVQMMIGREAGEIFPSRRASIGDTVLKVKNLNRTDRVVDVSFDVRAGEVLGFSGLVGSGRTETMRTIFGADRKRSGDIVLMGRPIFNRSPGQGVRNGIGMLPEDRKQQGVLLDLSIRTNAMMMPSNPLALARTWIQPRREEAETSRLMRMLRVKARDMDAPVSTLSGGNQQKVALMKWVLANGSVLILDEPTRGVDVGARVEIYQLINELAEAGVAVIVVSSDMLEIIGLCDRVLVMRNGKIAGEVSGNAINEQSLIELSMGVR